MIKKYKGFTFAEIMLALCTIGVLTIILIPAFNASIPNRNKLMFKKAYYITERTINELVNDQELYPESADNSIVGLNNIEVVGNLGDLKFCYYFANKLNIMTSANCSATNLTESIPSFVTNDNIAWYLPKVKDKEQYKITIDINNSKKPNCKYDPNSTTNCENPDRFEIFFEPNGHMNISGTKEIEYLSTSDSSD